MATVGEVDQQLEAITVVAQGYIYEILRADCALLTIRAISQLKELPEEATHLIEAMWHGLNSNPEKLRSTLRERLVGGPNIPEREIT